MNPDYFTTKEIAQQMADRFGDGRVILTEEPIVLSEYPLGSGRRQYHIFAHGREINAGILAAYYQRNPPEKFPGLADKLIRDVLDREVCRLVPEDEK